MPRPVRRAKTMNQNRTVEFFRLIREARLPKRAERAAAGYLPSRAMRYCDALTSATAYGYWVFPPIPGLAAWEGIVETDIWFGPLFNNFRITRTGEPVFIRSHAPFLQAQPVPQLAYREEILSDFACLEASDLTSSDWDRLGQVLLPHPDPHVRQGAYAVMVRKRRLCPVDHSALEEKQAD